MNNTFTDLLNQADDLSGPMWEVYKAGRALESENAELKQELVNSVHEMGLKIAELKGNERELTAHVKRLRDVIFHATCELAESDISEDDGLKELHSYLLKANNEIPAQSIREIQREAMEKLKSEILDLDYPNAIDDADKMLRVIADMPLWGESNYGDKIWNEEQE
jgi:hypothetical protein